MIKPVEVRIEEDGQYKRKLITLFDLADKSDDYKEFLSTKKGLEEDLRKNYQFGTKKYNNIKMQNAARIRKLFLGIVGDYLSSIGFGKDLTIVKDEPRQIIVEGEGILREEKTSVRYEDSILVAEARNSITIQPKIMFNIKYNLEARSYIDTWGHIEDDRVKEKWMTFFGVLEEISIVGLGNDGIKKPILFFNTPNYLSFASADFCAKAMQLIPHVFETAINNKKHEDLISINTHMLYCKIASIKQKEVEPGKEEAQKLENLKEEITQTINDFLGGKNG